MTILVCTGNEVIDIDTGEVIYDVISYMGKREGIFACYGSYHYFGKWVDKIRAAGWIIAMTEAGRHKTLWVNNTTTTNVRYISIKRGRVRDAGLGKEKGTGAHGSKNKKRYVSRLKWTVISMREWHPNGKEKDIAGDVRELVKLAEARGVRLRSTKGSTASALLRESPEWKAGRVAAPWFMDQVARTHAQGGFYSLRHNTWNARRVLHVDQRSSHLNIAANTLIPNPEQLRSRGFTLAAQKGVRRQWYSPEQLSSVLRTYAGLYYATIQCDYIPLEKRHLYPPWALKPGEHEVVIWSSDLSLFDERVRLSWISGGFLSPKPDWAVCEYSTWALEQIEAAEGKVIKPVLLAGIGILGVTTTRGFDRIVVGQKTPPRGKDVKIHLFGDGYRSSIERQHHPAVQNRVALGVIEAECRARSLLLARRFEGEGIPVVQVAADAVLPALDQEPLWAADGSPFIPDGWKTKALDNWRTYGIPNQIICDGKEDRRLPGIPRRRHDNYLRIRQPWAMDRTSVQTPQVEPPRVDKVV